MPGLRSKVWLCEQTQCGSNGQVNQPNGRSERAKRSEARRAGEASQTDKSTNQTGIYLQSVSFFPFCLKISFILEKCLQPKNPLYAESGLG